MLGHPLQRRVAHHDVGVGLGFPRLDVTDLRVHAPLLADSTISGELSHASITASGQRSASVAVRLPGPQPRSTTRRGFSAPTRDVRSKKGLPRWSAKVR